MIRTLSPR